MPITFMPKNIYGKRNLLVVDVGGDQGGGGNAWKTHVLRYVIDFGLPCYVLRLGIESTMY